jgi:hypothetical protein
MVSQFGSHILVDLMQTLFTDINAMIEELEREKEEKAQLSSSNSNLGEGDEEESESADDSSVSSDSMEDSNLIDHEGIDAKLKYIKDTDVEDKSSLALGTALKFMIVFYGIVYLVALIVFNLLPNPLNNLTMMDKLAEASNIMGDAVGAARQLQLQQVEGISDGFSCSWKIGDRNACGFADKNNVSIDLLKVDKKLEELNSWFSLNYAQLRTVGDIVDKYYSGEQSFYEFLGENKNEPKKTAVQSWPELLLSKTRTYLAMLIRDESIENSRLAWNFFIYNREIFYDTTFDVIHQVPTKIFALLETELLVHLIFTIILLVTGLVFFIILILDLFYLGYSSNFKAHPSRSYAYP